VRRRGTGVVVGLLAAATMALGLGAASASAAPVTQTFAPANTSPTSSCFPFHTVSGSGGWVPFAGFVYKNISAFDLQAGDELAFDSDSPNTSGEAAQLQISAAPTTVNGGDVPAGAFTTVVANTAPTLGGAGDAAVGNFDLRFKAAAPFKFAGGGLILRFSSPAGPFASDTTCAGGITSSDVGDASGFLVKRFFQDADGVPPYPNQSGTFIGGFRVSAVRPCQGSTATIIGTDGNDTLAGTAAADVISAGAGDDIVTGLGGKDVLCGGDGRDSLSGGAGADKLSGDAGKDTLKGGAGKDRLKGGPGKDKLRGGKGRDVLKGGPGKDNERQ